MSTVREAVEIWFPIEPDYTGYPQSQRWEQLWSWPTEAGYQIDNIPFFAKGISRGDVVSANKTDRGWLRFDTVLVPSGNSTFRIWLAEEIIGESEAVLSELRRMGCVAEITLDRLIGVDVGPSIEERVWEYLQDGLQAGRWDLQVGCSQD
jgi:Domain of unknown function (DUF4265)